MTWKRRLLEREVLAIAGLGLALGLLAGFGGFYVASSRGLDRLGVGEATAAVAAVLVVALLAYGLIRLAWSDDARWIVLLVVLLAGAWVGERAAFQVLPGNSTDGTLQLSVGRTTEGFTLRAKCTWDEQAGRVMTVEARENRVVAAHVAATVRLAEPASQTSELTLTGLAPVSFEPVVAYTAEPSSQLTDATGRSGETTATALAVEDLLEPGTDPTLAGFVREGLERAGAAQRVHLTWECPRLPHL